MNLNSTDSVVEGGGALTFPQRTNFGTDSLRNSFAATEEETVKISTRDLSLQTTRPEEGSKWQELQTMIFKLSLT